MTADSANLILEDLVVESRLELSLSRRGTGDIHSGLTTTEDDKVLLGSDSCAVQGGIGDVSLENLKVLGGNKLSWVSIQASPRNSRFAHTLEVLSLQAVMK